MMIFLGLVLLVMYTVAFINGGIGKTIFKEVKELEDAERTGYLSEEDKLKKALKISVKVIGLMLYSIVGVLFYTIFLIGALSVDVFLIPTLIMIFVAVYIWVRNFTSKKQKEKIKKKDMTVTHTSDQWERAFYILYVLYILVLLIL